MSVGIIHLYKGVLQLCALIFAFQTRKVKIEGLNDAKYISAFVYTTSIILAMTFISSLALYDYINIHAVVYSFGVWVAISAVLGFMFIPKVGLYCSLIANFLYKFLLYILHGHLVYCLVCSLIANFLYKFFCTVI